MKSTSSRLLLIAIISVAFAADVLIYACDAYGELYYWRDDRGVLHVTDDKDKVPYEYREKTKTMEESEQPSPAREPSKRSYEPAPAPGSSKGPELYGGKTLKWWATSISSLKEDIKELEESQKIRLNYIEVFEGGRRFGKIFTEEEIARYEKYKGELSNIEEEIKKKEDELSELRRKATYYGVPKKYR